MDIEWKILYQEISFIYYIKITVSSISNIRIELKNIAKKMGLFINLLN